MTRHQALLFSPSPRRVPEPYLRAEIAAFALASQKSFELCLTELEPLLPDSGEDAWTQQKIQALPHGKTRELWRSCEAEFAPHTGWSLDRLVAARDRGWFGDHPRGDGRPVSMHDYLRALALSHLEPRAGVTEVAQRKDLTALDTAVHYRWLTLILPEDVIMAALGVDPMPTHVEMEPPLLVKRLLDLGVAEIHHHVGGGMDFPLLWVSALAAIAMPTVRKNDLESPGAPFSNGKDMIHWLLAAAVIRCTLAEYMIRGDGTFQSFLSNFGIVFPRRAVQGMDENRDGRKANTAWTMRKRAALVGAMNALARADAECLPEFQDLRELYANMHPTALTLEGESSLKDVTDAYARCDPIAVRLQLSGKNVGERWFLRKGLACLKDGPCVDDAFFARLFWQVVRVRCQYYRSVVERPRTGGLQWFIRFYNRLGNLRRPLEPIRPQVSYHVAGEGRHIRVLELRHSARKSAVETGEEVLQFLRSWQRVLDANPNSRVEPEMGIIYSFIKDRDAKKQWPRGTPPAFWANTNAEPDEELGADVEHGRYAGYFARQCHAAHALIDFIRAVPSSLWVIRGLDMDTDELGVPTWVLVPIFRSVYEAAAEASLREAENAGPPLKLTGHVGEDFRHLLEGLRRIYEQVHYVLRGTGRLGHAIALGVEPQSWADSVSSVLLPAEERLWDLVFEWRLYTRFKVRPEYAAAAPEGRIAVLLNEVRALSAHIYGHTYSVEELAEAHHLLHRFLMPPYVPKPEISGDYNAFLHAARDLRTSAGTSHIKSRRAIARLLECYLGNEAVFLRGQSLVDVPVHREVAALTAVQDALRRGISQDGIVVEVNPSSNLFIGDMLDMRNHPVLRLFPPLPEPDTPPPVTIALGSDDPITFSTHLMNEYTLLYQAACRAGYPERTVQDWLEDIRRAGMEARFTAAWPQCGKKKLIDVLIDQLRDYLQEPKSIIECDQGRSGH